MLIRINLSIEDLAENSRRCAEIVKSWTPQERNVFGGLYKKKIVDGKIVLYQEKVMS